MGLEAAPIARDMADQLGLRSGTDGVVVTKVSPDSPAAAGGLETDDVIVEINRNEITGLDDLDQVLEGDPDQLVLFVQRRGSSLYIALESPE